MQRAVQGLCSITWDALNPFEDKTKHSQHQKPYNLCEGRDRNCSDGRKPPSGQKAAAGNILPHLLTFTKHYLQLQDMQQK